MISPVFSAKLSSALYVAAALHVCPVGPTPDIKVSAHAAPTTYDYKMTLGQLTRTAKPNKSQFDASWKFPGRTEAHFGTKFNIRYLYQEQADALGTTCIYIQSINYDIEYVSKVRVASDYKKGSCRYKRTLEHEEKHVATDKKLLAAYEQGISETLDRFALKPLTQYPVKNTQVDAAIDAFDQKIKAALTSQSEALDDKRAKQQGAIDTIENYKREQKLCP